MICNRNFSIAKEIYSPPYLIYLIYAIWIRDALCSILTKFRKYDACAISRWGVRKNSINGHVGNKASLTKYVFERTINVYIL